MIDIKFYQLISGLKKQITETKELDKEYVFAKLEEFRSKTPTIYNIETTNFCNMKCKMCPRTTLMTRKVQTLDIGSFKLVSDQIFPFSFEDWSEWENFVVDFYGISKNGMSENHFFLYIIPKVIVLHGFGEPVLDKDLLEKIKILSERKIQTYFSCNPFNIKVDQIEKMFDSGLNYIKFSMESSDDVLQKKVRGASDFYGSVEKINKLLNLIENKRYNSTIVISVIRLNSNKENEFEKIKNIFKDTNVYLYEKAQDEQWYAGVDQKLTSIHWREFCQFPWSSMTVLSNGDVVPCTQDFNAEIVLGNIKNNSLMEIWSGEKYYNLRKEHFDSCNDIKCNKRCDMKTINNFARNNI